MADNAQKTWYARNANSMARKRAIDNQQIQVKATPVTVTAVDGAFVTVQFELQSGYTLPKITIPKSESKHMRLPTQVGEKGLAIAADFYLGGQSEDGGGVANDYPRGNLTPLVYVPIGQKSFPAVDKDQVVASGPKGAVMKTDAGTNSIEVNLNGVQMKSQGGSTGISFDASGVTITVPLGTTLIIKNLPTTPPATAGGLWNSGGFVKVV